MDVHSPGDDGLEAGRRAQRERANARSRAYNARHPERKAESQRKYLAKREAWERHLALGRRSYARHAERRNAETNEWRRLNPAAWANIQRRRRERMKGATALDPAMADAFADVIRRDPCSYCGRPSTAVDHIIPISGGGTVEWDNLAPSCKPCNSSKKDRPLLLWLAIRQAV